MANKSKVQSVEPDIADLVNGWLKSYGLDYKLEQASLNSEIDKALDEYHSKSGGKGGNRPDAKLLLKDKYETFYPVLIEYKGYKDKLVKLDTDGIVDNKKDKNEPNYTNIKSYAVNGAIHYANAILHYTSYTRIIAIGVTGYKDEFGKLQHEIGVYYVSADKNNLGFGQRVGDYTDLSFLKPSHFDEFVEKLNELSLTQAEIDKLKEKREKEINISLVKLNNDIYKEETGLGENDRIYLVAATIIATLGAEGVKPLEKSDLGSSTESGETDGDKIIRKITSFLKKKQLPQQKQLQRRISLKNFSKYISLFIIMTIILVTTFPMTACNKENADNSVKKITLCEVTHSIFYAPQYVAIENGYFADEGLELTVTNGFGADKVMTALISGDADIGFMGSESSIYVYAEGSDDYAVNFAGLTQRAGNFLVRREANDNFEWSELKGKTVIGGRAGGMPQMLFEYILKKNNINPETDLEILQNVDFGSTSAAFTSGIGDYTVEFEPSATLLEQQGEGHVIASLGVESGYVPYTAYCAKKSYIKKNPDVIQKFTNATQKGLDYVNTHSSAEIAAIIAPQFKETDIATITAIVERYKSQDTWKTSTVFTEDSFNLLQDILTQAGELKSPVPYSSLVTTEFSEKALNKQ